MNITKKSFLSSGRVCISKIFSNYGIKIIDKALLIHLSIANYVLIKYIYFNLAKHFSIIYIHLYNIYLEIYESL